MEKGSAPPPPVPSNPATRPAVPSLNLGGIPPPLAPPPLTGAAAAPLPGGSAPPPPPPMAGRAPSSSSSAAAAAALPRGVSTPRGPPLRALHWTKVPQHQLEDSVWLQLPGAIDREEELKLFTIKAQPGEGGGASKLPATPRGGVKKVMLLELERSNQISIALAKFKPYTSVQVADAVLRLDDTIIKVEDISRLRACIPTADEIELLSHTQQRRGCRDSASSRRSSSCWYMARVPRLSQRLECFSTKLTLPTRLARARRCALSDAADAVRASAPAAAASRTRARHRQRAQHRHSQGQRQGFRLDVLQKLAKRNPRSELLQSLLYYLAKVAARRSPTCTRRCATSYAPSRRRASRWRQSRRRWAAAPELETVGLSCRSRCCGSVTGLPP